MLHPRDAGKIIPFDPKVLLFQSAVTPGAKTAEDNGKDNSALRDDNKAQTLSAAEIESMKKAGADGTAIIAAVVQNSATFKSKTEFSQEKYLRKKQKKHLFVARLLRATVASICDACYGKDPNKIGGLRLDGLGMMMSRGNVRAYSKALVVESAFGLLTAAAAERLGGFGTVFHVYSGAYPHFETLKRIRPSQAIKDSVVSIPFKMVNALAATRDATPAAEPEGEAEGAEEALRPRDVYKHETLAQIRARMGGGCDSLLIANAEYSSMAMLLGLLPLLLPSRSFAVFSQSMQELAECASWLSSSNYAVNVQLCDVSTRFHQVLPERTHPEMGVTQLMAGYVLSGTTTDVSPPGSKARPAQ